MLQYSRSKTLSQPSQLQFVFLTKELIFAIQKQSTPFKRRNLNLYYLIEKRSKKYAANQAPHEKENQIINIYGWKLNWQLSTSSNWAFFRYVLYRKVAAKLDDSLYRYQTYTIHWQLYETLPAYWCILKQWFWSDIWILCETKWMINLTKHLLSISNFPVFAN